MKKEEIIVSSKAVTRSCSSRPNVLKAEECLSRLRAYLEAGDMRTYREFDDRRIEGHLELDPDNLGKHQICGLSFRSTNFTGNLVLRGLEIIGSGLELNQARLQGKLMLFNVTFAARLVHGPSPHHIQPEIRVDSTDARSCQLSHIAGVKRISFSGSEIETFVCLEDVTMCHAVDLRDLRCGSLDITKLETDWLLMNNLKVQAGSDNRVMIVDPRVGKILCEAQQAPDLFYLTGGRIPLVYRPDW